MEKIKKQFKQFWAYFRLVQRGAGTNEAGKRMRGYVPALIIILVALVISSIQMNLDFSFVEGVIIGSAMGMGICTAVKPSALSVAPFSPKQRMVFTFLSALLMSLIAILFIFVISALFVLFIAFIAFCINGENIFASALPTESYSAYGSAFGACMLLLFFFATYAIFHLERKRNVTIASVVFIALIEIFTLVMTNLCENAIPMVQPAVYDSVYGSFRFSMYSDVRTNIIYLYAPWAPILVLSILNALAIAATVFMTIRRFKSDKI